VNRHESLRTVFLEKEGVGYQELLSSAEFHIERKTFYNTTEKMLEVVISNEVNRPFDLSKDYMLRVKVLELSEEVNVLVVVMHHIAADGWSIPILINELEELYNSGLSGKPIRLPELPVQYADYSIWQREYLSGEILDKRLGYWENQLDGVETLELPLDFNRPATQSNQGASYTFKLEIAQSNQLKALAKENGTTLFMLLLTLYKVLLHRYTNQEDICVGVPVANRSESAISGLIG
ncbi:condensation domain-containing protein, partial [Ascidiimonas sp. W6]|uniref:condensation domain-containing protein n=1 Tax=Ascidiimonas meishanensis TaxID=3128903 RepID=UPI0030ECF5F1